VVAVSFYTWVKYGRLILPEVFKLNEVQNSSILGVYRNFLRDFLCVDLEGNVSKTLNVSTNLNSMNIYHHCLRGRDNQNSIGSICNNHSSVHIHQFISPEVLNA
jgi:hypothetical protein